MFSYCSWQIWPRQPKRTECLYWKYKLEFAILGDVVPSLQNLFSLMHPGSLSLLMKASKHERGVDCIMLLLTVAC